MTPAAYNANQATTHGIAAENIGASSWADLAAIKAWQSAHRGLTVDGRFGPASVAAYRAEHATTKVQLVTGLDVSAWQKAIDWPRVAAAGHGFAYVKATEDEGYTSGAYRAQVKGALAARLDVGAYHFAVPERGDSPEAEADRLVDALAGFAFTLRPVLDFEEAHQGKKLPGGAPDPKHKLPAEVLVPWAGRFVARCEARLGYLPTFYTYSSFLAERRTAFAASALARCALWIAAYSKTAPKNVSPWPRFDAWQYTQKGVVPGIAGKVDLNLAPRGLDDLRIP